MADDKYADDIRLIDLSQHIVLKRGSDIVADAIIYHGDCWWKVLGNGRSNGSDFLYTEKAGSIRYDAEEVEIPIDDAKTYLVVLEGAPLQFRDGDCYYAPVEAEEQGIDKNWMLMEHYALILEWRPVDIAAVLREAI